MSERATYTQVAYALELMRRRGLPTLWPNGHVRTIGLHERLPVPEQLGRMSRRRIGRLIRRLE